MAKTSEKCKYIHTKCPVTHQKHIKIAENGGLQGYLATDSTQNPKNPHTSLTKVRGNNIMNNYIIEPVPKRGSSEDEPVKIESFSVQNAYNT